MSWCLVSYWHEALRLGGRSGFLLRLRLGCLGLRAVVLRRVFLSLRLALRLCVRLALLLALPPPAPRAPGLGLRSGEVVGERVRDLLDRPESLARCVDQLVRARRVALGRGE